METREFPFVVLPADAEKTLGERYTKTRTYGRKGHESDFAEWYDALVTHVGPVMTPGEVALYVDVSRPAIHKRMQTGGITAFVLSLEADQEQEQGKKRRLRASDITYIPQSECQAWREERMARLSDAQQDEIDTLAEELARTKAELEKYKEQERQRRVEEWGYDPEEAEEQEEGWTPSAAELRQIEAEQEADQKLAQKMAKEREAEEGTRKGGKS